MMGESSIDFVVRFIEALDVDPFIYLVVVIAGVGLWIYGTVVGDFALSGPAVLIRRAALVIASVAALFFFVAARRLM